MAKPPINLIERNVPAQVDPADLEAEIELDVPGSFEPKQAGDIEGDPNIEIEVEEDGGVVVDFDPAATLNENKDENFFENLAENLSNEELSRLGNDLLAEYDANKSSRQEWEDAYS